MHKLHFGGSMSTKPKPKLKRLTILIPDEWDEKIKKKAAALKISKSAVVKIALQKVLNDEQQ